MNKLANVYANALFEISLEEKQDKELLEETQALRIAFEQNPQFAAVLSAPMISQEEKKTVIDNAFKGNVNTYLLNFIKVMADRKAANLLVDSFEAFETIYNKHYNIEKIVATTAVSMSSELCQKLTDKLTKVTGKTVFLENRVDAACLGGVVLEFSDKQIDNSIAQKLKAFKVELAKI